MDDMIERYIKKMNIDDVKNFAISKNIILSDEELQFTYNFVKKNYRDFLNNPKVFDLSRYKNNYSPENFAKINKVWNEYYSKYANYL